jgi:hypothetical protein
MDTNFRNTFLTEEEAGFTTSDIIEILPELDEEELDIVGECIMGILEDEEVEDIDMDMGVSEILDEKKFFKTKKRELNREKKKDKAQKKRDAKKRKMYYRKNKAKIKRKGKLYNKKVKRNPNMVRRHKK